MKRKQKYDGRLKRNRNLFIQFIRFICSATAFAFAIDVIASPIKSLPEKEAKKRAAKEQNRPRPSRFVPLTERFRFIKPNSRGGCFRAFAFVRGRFERTECRS